MHGYAGRPRRTGAIPRTRASAHVMRPLPLPSYRADALDEPVKLAGKSVAVPFVGATAASLVLRLNIVRFQYGFRGHTLSSPQGVRGRLFIRLFVLNCLRTGTIVLGMRQWLHNVLYRHRCAERYSDSLRHRFAGAQLPSRRCEPPCVFRRPCFLRGQMGFWVLVQIGLSER